MNVSVRGRNRPTACRTRRIRIRAPAPALRDWCDTIRRRPGTRAPSAPTRRLNTTALTAGLAGALQERRLKNHRPVEHFAEAAVAAIEKVSAHRRGRPGDAYG